MSFRGFKGNTAADCKDYAAAHLLKGERFLRAGGSISSREGKKHRILGGLPSKFSFFDSRYRSESGKALQTGWEVWYAGIPVGGVGGIFI